MVIRERLEELTKAQLFSIARELKAEGFSGLNKLPLIDHIISRCTEDDISAILDRDFPVPSPTPKLQTIDVKTPWWKRHKFDGLMAIIAVVSLIFTIYSALKPSVVIVITDEVVEIIAKNNPGLSPEELPRLRERVEELKTALEDERAGSSKERKQALEALSKGKLDRAEALFIKAIEKEKDRIEKNKENLAKNYFNLGNVYYLKLKYKKALENYNKAIEIKPDYHEAWSNKGAALDDLGRRDEALKAFDKAIQFKPDLHQAWNYKGDNLGKLGRYEEALEAYDRAIEIKPDYHRAWYSKGIFLSRLGRREDALKAYDRAIEIKPDYHVAWFNKGLVLRWLGREDEARRAIEVADKLAKNSGSFINYK